MFWIIAIIVIAIICTIVDEGGPFAKTVLVCGVAAIAFALIFWITDWDFLMTLVKACGVIAILSILIPILLAILGKD